MLGFAPMSARSTSRLAFALACALLPARGLTQAAASPSPARGRLGSLFAPAAPGAGAEPELAQIAELIRRLEHHAHAQAGRRALASARSALKRARSALASQDSARATRAKQSAWAALALASRRIALGAAERARVMAELRAQKAERARADAQQRLERAREAAVVQASER